MDLKIYGSKMLVPLVKPGCVHAGCWIDWFDVNWCRQVIKLEIGRPIKSWYIPFDFNLMEKEFNLRVCTHCKHSHKCNSSTVWTVVYQSIILMMPFGNRRYCSDDTKPLPDPILTWYFWHRSQCNFRNCVLRYACINYHFTLNFKEFYVSAMGPWVSQHAILSSRFFFIVYSSLSIYNLLIVVFHEIFWWGFVYDALAS